MKTTYFHTFWLLLRPLWSAETKDRTCQGLLGRQDKYNGRKAFILLQHSSHKRRGEQTTRLMTRVGYTSVARNKSLGLSNGLICIFYWSFGLSQTSLNRCLCWAEKPHRDELLVLDYRSDYSLIYDTVDVRCKEKKRKRNENQNSPYIMPLTWHVLF